MLKLAAAVAVGCASALWPALAEAGHWRSAQKLAVAGSEPQVAVLPGGEATIVWGPHAVSPDEAGGAGVEAALRPPGGVFGQPVRLSPAAGVAARLVVGPSGHEVVTWASDSSYTFQFAARPPGGAFATAHDILHATGDVTVDGEGQVYALVTVGRFGDARLAVAAFSPDGTLTGVRELPKQATMLAPTLSADAAGDVTVAWRGQRDGESVAETHVYATTAAPGQPFPAPQTLSGPYFDDNSSGQQTRTVGDARGDVLVAWPQEPGVPQGVAAPTQDATLYAAYKPAGGSFGPPEPIRVPSTSHGVYRWHAAIGPHGEALVAWTDVMSVSMAFRPPGGPFEPARPAGSYPEWGPDTPTVEQGEPAVAFDAAGDAIVIYSTTGLDHRTIEAVRRPAGGGFEPPQSVTDVAPVNDPAVGIDSNGDALAAWSPQARDSWSPSDDDFGIYMAEYDADARPQVERAALRRRRHALALESTDAGRARVVVKRARRTVVRRRRHVVPGENVVRLRPRERRALTRHGGYVATITVRDRSGRVSKPRRVRFHGIRRRSGGRR